MDDASLQPKLQNADVPEAVANNTLADRFMAMLLAFLQHDGHEVKIWVRKTEIQDWKKLDTVTHRETYLSYQRDRTWLARFVDWLVADSYKPPFIARTATRDRVVRRIEIGDSAVLPEARGIMKMLRSLPQHASARVLLTIPGIPNRDITNE